LQEFLVSILAQFWDFLRTNKKLWLAPIIILLLMLGGVVLLTEGPALSQFLYPDF
jgi:hypothetical protein